MSKFTDRFFGFPIKIYDGFQLRKAMEKEEIADVPQSADWISGIMRLPADELHMIYWHDGFSRERTVGDAIKEGFDLTIVYSEMYGEFTCTWERKKFEEKLNEFVDRYIKAGYAPPGGGTDCPEEGSILTPSNKSPKE